MKKNYDKKIYIFEGPSGVGKDAIMNILIERYPKYFSRVVSTTTREMRDNESEGNPYHFVKEKVFDRMLKNGDIFESTERHGTKRGMSQKAFEDILNEKKYPIKDCDRFGLEALKKIYGEKVISFYIIAPKKEVKKRLINRGDEGADLEKRLKDYDKSVRTAKYYDYQIENIDLEKSVDEILKIMDLKR